MTLFSIALTVLLTHQANNTCITTINNVISSDLFAEMNKLVIDGANFIIFFE